MDTEKYEIEIDFAFGSLVIRNEQTGMTTHLSSYDTPKDMMGALAEWAYDLCHKQDIKPNL